MGHDRSHENKLGLLRESHDVRRAQTRFELQSGQYPEHSKEPDPLEERETEKMITYWLSRSGMAFSYVQKFMDYGMHDSDLVVNSHETS